MFRFVSRLSATPQLPGKDLRWAPEFFNLLVLGSLLLFALNNGYLKARWHNAFTGKLSDLLFCFFFPLYVSALLALVTRVSLRTRLTAGCLFTLTGFTAVKTSLYVSSALHEAMAPVARLLLGQPSVNHVDPTDLIALPMIAVACWFALYKNRSIRRES